jgi:hypothetical protein
MPENLPTPDKSLKELEKEKNQLIDKKLWYNGKQLYICWRVLWIV